MVHLPIQLNRAPKQFLPGPIKHRWCNFPFNRSIHQNEFSRPRTDANWASFNSIEAYTKMNSRDAERKPMVQHSIQSNRAPKRILPRPITYQWCNFPSNRSLHQNESWSVQKSIMVQLSIQSKPAPIRILARPTNKIGASSHSIEPCTKTNSGRAIKTPMVHPSIQSKHTPKRIQTKSPEIPILNPPHRNKPPAADFLSATPCLTFAPACKLPP